MPRIDTYPEESDLVVGTVHNVKNYGAFILLDEYDNREGFIHVAEVATGWVKYIRDYIREGQKVVCKVLRVNPEKGHVDLSLKQVNDHQRREKVQEWKNEQKADKLLEIVMSRMKLSLDDWWEKHGEKLLEKFGTLYGAFEACTVNPEALKEAKFRGKWIEVFVQVSSENISPPFVTIDGFLDLTCPLPDGIHRIKDALKKAVSVAPSNITIQYLGAPKYQVKVEAPDYKIAEETFREAGETAVTFITKHEGTGRYYKVG